jgi:hexosaminidase
MFRRTICRIVRTQSSGLRYTSPLARIIPFAVVCLIASAACASSVHPTPARAPVVSDGQFVTVQDGRFKLDGQPHVFAGVNFWQAMNLGATANRQRLLAELDHLQRLGVTNLRVMAASEGPNSEPQRMVPALMTAPVQYDPAVLDGLDFLLAELGRRDMQAVLVLNNFWQWSGGMAQYVSWAEDSAIPYPGDWERFQAYAARFYNCADCQRWYREHIQTLIQRVNPYTGLTYSDDPAISAWELANEPRRYPQRWIDETAAFIKSLDPNHLVTTGVEGALPWREQDFRAAHDGPDIDYATVHIWPQNWGWYDPQQPASYEAAEAKALQYLREHAAIAAELGKPLVLEEFGLARDYEPLGNILDPASPTTLRDRFFTAMFAEVSASAAAGGPLAGHNLWAWSGQARPGDPWVGDPPHEEPGWYSVYGDDASTLAVLAGSAPIVTMTSQPEATPKPKEAPAMNPIIPLPLSITETGDTFTLTGDSQIIVDPGSAELVQIGDYLAQWLGAATGGGLPVLAGDEARPAGAIRLTLAGADPALGDEGYELTVTPDGVTIAASQPAGVFYGVQTLRQLLPAELESGAAQPGDSPWAIPTVVIRDAPRFAWRGMMLDVARHFFPAEDVKRLIDLLAAYKLNRLHLHLTDDQGWRLMIESWPRLAEVGGSTAVDGDPGGYFTQAEYADIVAYARSRYIDIAPEIDLPGHTNAALAAYAELNCDGKARELYSGIEVGFSSLCIDKDVTYQFVDDVIREVAALTPGLYIHVGGDEAHSTPDADYARFMTRVQEIVRAHGKQMLAWEEAARIELAPGSAVQHWHSEMATRAAGQGAQVIMSPAAHAYLDMKYDDSTALGLNWAGNISVERAYDWDPATVQPGIPEEAILGVEAPLWTETVRTVDDLEYLVFPRLLGHAEIGWSPAAGRSWDDYRQRLAGHAARLEALGVNFYRGWMED